ncbi:hypothetical protein VA249_36380 [Vibrio alfacsensis]|uniref:hypothetical protein n=1 Tax=Vibrio alfacsensis TaxID=1074311 RepID=UPI001BEE24D5|nr:hypothetical protein [Vibrio alfacsensis]BBM66992.1 hypothetical protein VA249_36380 [Vibrio alfacsensis]
MKRLASIAAVAMFSMSAQAAVDPLEGNSGDIMLTGEVAKKCVLNLDKFRDQPYELSLEYPAVQSAGPSIRTWCNNSTPPSISFTSKNGGLWNEEADKTIPYTAWMDGFGSLDLAGNPKVMPENEFGQGSDYHQRPIRYTPVVNGLEIAGTYTDTITIEITPN